MDTATPRRSVRINHFNTPKMSERKKGLFQSDEDSRSSMTQHRLPAVESDSDVEDYDLGIISTLDSSSSDEFDQNVPRTPEKIIWHETRSHTKKSHLKQSHLKNFLRSPFTLNKFQTKYTSMDSVSTPATPRDHHHLGTPSSTHSTTSVHATTSERSRARKSLASLIADTESCSSSLKDLNFDTDSDTDAKENAPQQDIRKSTRMKKMTPKFASFKGILMEQRKNQSSPTKPVAPSHIYRTPENTPDVAVSPPKINHNRRSVVEIAESPEPMGNNEKCYKRLRNETMSDTGPNPKHLKLDTICTVPKARLSLFANDLREISTKSFYGKTDFNNTLATKLSTVITVSTTERKLGSSLSHKRRNKKIGQINMGVRHRIKKPKIHDRNRIINLNVGPSLKAGYVQNTSNFNNISASQNSSQTDIDIEKADPFDKEKQTIDTLLSQWTEDEVPESELVRRPELACFNKTVMEDSPIFNPVALIPVESNDIQPESQQILELGSKGFTGKPDQSSSTQVGVETGHQDVVMDEGVHASEHGKAKTNFLPVEGGYIVVDENAQEDLPDLDEIERELRMLDEQILRMAQSNNMNASAVLASTETMSADVESNSSSTADAPKLFPIFGKATPEVVSTSPKKNKVPPMRPARRTILKNGSQQYVIDAGQKKFGATQCKECDVIYQIGDPQDEYDHLVYHHAIDVLKYNGLKDETVCGAWGEGRCVRVRGGKGGQWRRVQTLLARVVHPHLGYPEELPRDCHSYTAYLYIEKKRIIGCAVIEPKALAQKLIPGDPDCCSTENYPVKCGVSRIWTHVSHRRRGIARRLLDCARASFLYGQAIPTEEIAFSAPTQAGKEFATKYTGTETFFVYLD